MSFIVDGRNYAIPLSDVAEITPYRELNHMPHMPKNVVGLLDLRGSVLPVLSIRIRMGKPNKESHVGDMILLLAYQDSRIGILVDQVESVITATEEQHAKISPMLEGVHGTWIRAILLLDGKVIVVLEPSALLKIDHDDDPSDDEEAKTFVEDEDDIEQKLDEGLRNLIALAGGKEEGHIVPILRDVIGRNETEVTKVLERVEKMLAAADDTFSGISKFKQETAMVGITAFDSTIAELDKSALGVQSNIFEIFDQLQYQDVIRQKLEKVLYHILGMQSVISDGFGGRAAS
jgi:purine-binding chemotaxis protein CheW